LEFGAKLLGESNPMNMRRRDLLALPVLSTSWNDTYHFAYEGVMGTSLDLYVLANTAATASDAEQAVLAEIDRLSRILSTYEADSVLSRLQSSGQQQTVPAELMSLLRAYEDWGRRSGGAISAALPGTRIELDPAGGRVRISGGNVNVDALGKTFITQLAANRAASLPGVESLLLNVGGDIAIQGRKGLEWKVAIANPSATADNATPLSEITVSNGFVATSAFYARGSKHIWDPRKTSLSSSIESATVFAPDGVTANALSTAICVLGAQQGLALLNSSSEAEGLILASGGKQLRSRGWSARETQLERVQATKGWGDKNEVTVMLKLRTFEGRRGKRPYVAVWAETEQGAVVKNIAVWIGPNRWWSELYSWWKLHEGKDLNPITRATRQAGDYKLVWDGLGDNGKPVPAGNYRIFVEVNREHGTYAKQQGVLACGGEKTSITLKESAEFEAVHIEYGPRSATA
jgi:FAD:protein FMN transferase